MDSNFSKRTLEDLKMLADIPETDLTQAIHEISELRNKDGLHEDKVLEILENVGLDQNSRDTFSNILYNLALMYGDKEALDSYLNFIEKEILSKKEYAKKIIELVLLKNIHREIRKNMELQKIKTFGIPHLSSVNVLPEYRILQIEDIKEVVSVIVFDALLHEVSSELDSEVIKKKVTFQLDSDQLNQFIDKLNDVKNKLESGNQLKLEEKFK